MVRTPSGGAGNGTAASAGRLMSIGAVLGQLRDEFPEVTISKIRFLEAEGLVDPRRTPSGYRKFSEPDVARLAQVLRMQRDHYLPLKVIKEHLEAAGGDEPPAGSGTGPSAGTPAADPAAVPRESAEPGPPLRLRRAELLDATGAEEAELAQWESYGLVEADDEGRYDVGAVTVGALLRELGAFGLEPRHLRAVKAAADREAGLVEQVVAPLRLHRNPQTRAHAEATARRLADLSVRLHEALVHSALRSRHA
ncbi:MerR family transcriptional regulator [Streptomyces sp. SL13]|uniref:MerR family transcriptional regulator n=1 Tax=Streptantibioticus silvisoli TaxID=2705255 RepID=A0AA90H268_9ACTN|nr:MerR family transcriptional regulator [Streptantibioticus silvisoli]MDI5969295.1 MerR family transcriptional regulator [Streptantibioticus silvisoli]